jgi:hypothetical protein
MPRYDLPGVAADRVAARAVGVTILALVLVVTLAVTLYRGLRPDDGLRISLHTPLVGDGITEGTEVRLDGVVVGRVDGISAHRPGVQQLTLRLDDSRVRGLDDSLGVDYVPANLFGISEVELRRGSGGAPLHPDAVIDLTGDRAADISDATMGNLLRGLSQVGGSVLTPQLSAVLVRLASDLHEFTPLLESMVVLARTVVGVQRVPPSLLAGRFGSTLGGGAGLIDSTIEVLNVLYTNEPLRVSRDKIDSGIAMVVHQLFPTLSTTLTHAGASFSGYTDMLVPVLDMLSAMVPDPQRSGTELRTIIDRLDRAMPDTPDGPVLRTQVELRGIPVLAPLVTAAGGFGGGR